MKPAGPGYSVTQLHKDHNGVWAQAIGKYNGIDVEGHMYQIGHSIALTTLYFQHGPVKEKGINGVTNEALLAIIMHRLGYLNQQFPCKENQDAMHGIAIAQRALNERTQGRINRGVEGKNEA